MAAQAYSQKTNIGGSLLTMTGYDDGSYTLFDSGGKTVGSGSAATGGKVEFTSTATESLYGNYSSTIESFNVSNLNSKLDNQTLSTISAAGYGNQMNIPGVTTPISQTAENIGAPTLGGNSGTDSGQTSTTTIPASEVGSSADANFRYPLSEIGSEYDHVIFTVVEYVPGGTEGFKGIIAGSGGRPTDRIKRANKKLSFLLPIPQNVEDTNQQGWGEDQMNALQAAGASIIQGALGTNGTTLKGALDNVLGGIAKNNAQLKQLIGAQTASSVIGGGNILTRTTGAVLNSNLELLFTGPSLRTFNFSYRLTPRDAKEADEIKNIVRSIKKAMSAKIKGNALFMYSPDVFFIDFIFRGNVHPFLNRIKPCALTSFNVNYTPDGAYMTYDNGSPVAYSINMSFQELEPIYDVDYDGGDGTEGMGF